MTARERRESAFLVGGFVRDYLLTGEMSSDVDVAVDGDGIAFGRALARRLEAHVHVRSEAYRVSRLFWTKQKIRWQIDVASIQGKNLRQDLARRDFTVNAAAVPVEGEPSFGLRHLTGAESAREDLRCRRLRSVSSRVFQDDPVRLLRAARLAEDKGCRPTPDLARLARAQARFVRRGTRERLTEEWWKICSSRKTADILDRLEAWGVLTALFPPLAAMKGVDQSLYHHLDVWDHTLEVIRLLDEWPRLLRGFPAWMKREVSRYAEAPVVERRSTRLAILKSAALFHDVAKPRTKKKGKDGKITFYGHDVLGARVVRRAGRWMKMSGEEVASQERIVAFHLRPGFLRLPDGGVSVKGARKFFREAKEDAVGILLFSLADRWAARGPKVTPEILARTRRTFASLMAMYADYRKPAPRPLLNGRDVMGVCGLKPGPLVGKILRAIEEARWDGEISTREEALKRAAALAKIS